MRNNSVAGRTKMCYWPQHVGYGRICAESVPRRGSTHDVGNRLTLTHVLGGVEVPSPLLAPYKRGCVSRVSDITVSNVKILSLHRLRQLRDVECYRLITPSKDTNRHLANSLVETDEGLQHQSLEVFSGNHFSVIARVFCETKVQTGLV